eukprot:384529-Prorocentrum_lima.AAC.1
MYPLVSCKSPRRSSISLTKRKGPRKRRSIAMILAPGFAHSARTALASVSTSDSLAKRVA